MKVLYSGQLYDGSTALHRADALGRLGAVLTSIDVTRRLTFPERIVNKIYRLLSGDQIGNGKLNKALLSAIASGNYDMLWVDKGLDVQPEVVRYFKAQNPDAPAVHYSPDDMLNPANQSKNYLNALSLYDLHVTTKSYNVAELKSIGAKDVLMVGNAFAPELHRRLLLTDGERRLFGSSVGFIGAYETERAGMIMSLAEAGVPVKVWGNSWKNLKRQHQNLHIVPETMMGENYIKVLNTTDINLCFLRKVNRDLQTTRTMEIPACGGFMLAERTSEHLELFEEGVEAEFFGSTDELIEKVKFYMKNPEQRKQIAGAGYQRCLNSGYSNDARLGEVLAYLGIVSLM